MKDDRTTLQVKATRNFKNCESNEADRDFKLRESKKYIVGFYSEQGGKVY